MTMIERVARAIYDAPDNTSGDFVAEAIMHSPYVNGVDDVMNICRAAARAAIEAMLDAEPEMIRALKPGMDYEEAYTSMIKAALEEK